MLNPPQSHTSAPPELAQYDELLQVQRVCLLVVAALSAVILCGWIVPYAGEHLPVGWAQMKANTAFLVLLSACGLACTLPDRSNRMILLSRWLGLFTFANAFSVLMEYIFSISTGLDSLLANDRLALLPGRMSPQTATVFCLLGLLTTLICVRTGMLAHAADVLLSCLSLTLLAVLSGYVFGALLLFGPSLANRTSPHTLSSLILLTFVAVAQRARYGSFSILLEAGTGGRMARVAAPVAMALPFALGAASIVLIRTGAMDLRYATAIVASVASMLSFGTVIIVARLIENQETKIRDLSLRDGLTELYNRRGFYILADQALRLAQRSHEPFSVFFIDLDNLKSVNDSLGHEAGSIFIREVADLLRGTFRSNEIIGRIGGDEFAVAIGAGEHAMEIITRRLVDAVKKQNSMPARAYPFSLSLGCATTESDKTQSLEDLLASADKSMYGAKLRNKVELLFSGAEFEA